MPFNVQIAADISQVVIGLAAIYSLLLSRRALKKADWNTELSTVPSIIIRPIENYIALQNPGEMGGGVATAGQSITSQDNDQRIIYLRINFDCINGGRGTAFNIKKPTVDGVEFEDRSAVPLHQLIQDSPFRFSVTVRKSFKEWYEMEKPINVKITLEYTNDQNNVSCTSNWSAELKPLEKREDKLTVRAIRILKRAGGVAYKQI